MTDDTEPKGLTSKEQEQFSEALEHIMRGEGPQELAGSLGEKVRAMLQKLKELYPHPTGTAELSPELVAWLDAYVDMQEKKLH